MTACSSLNQTKVHTGTNRKALQSYSSGTGWESMALLGSTRISQSVHTVGMWMVLTKANALLQLKEVGSHGEDAPDTSIHVRDLNPLKVSGERTDQHMCAGLLCKKSHDLQ